jgi:hypothetical protein
MSFSSPQSQLVRSSVVHNDFFLILSLGYQILKDVLETGSVVCKKFSNALWNTLCPAVVIDGKDKHFVSSMQCSFSFSDVIVGGTW